MIKSEYKVIGVMSGTSLDGIDLIYASYIYDGKWSFEIHSSETIRYTNEWRLILAELVNKQIEELQVIDTKYSEFLGCIILEYIEKNKFENIDFIATHGHTALHQPENGLTYQIGNKQVLADVLQRKVICDFRIQDVKFGGQGAPLVPIGDKLLFNEFDYCINLGGFANVSFEEDESRIAFDICPVNIVLNHYVSKLNLEYDDKGQLASTGNINQKLLLELNNLHFYNIQPPKSLGLEWVEHKVFKIIDTYNIQLNDILRTFVEHIAIQISKVITIENAEALFTGGGVYNDFLMTRLDDLCKSKIVIPLEETIEFKEALIFGLLGVLKERDEINCLKTVTGAKHDHSSGKILIPNS